MWSLCTPWKATHRGKDSPLGTKSLKKTDLPPPEVINQVLMDPSHSMLSSNWLDLVPVYQPAITAIHKCHGVKTMPTHPSCSCDSYPWCWVAVTISPLRTGAFVGWVCALLAFLFVDCSSEFLTSRVSESLGWCEMFNYIAHFYKWESWICME